ncbi:VOC family protein [Lacrimispora sp. BS-2]|uniref:VOC family protein n=1 Tax=Lacrimispora sp. BS-2 TaxID=3151850 RepID=A0AAU7PTX2_9FIRM
MKLQCPLLVVTDLEKSKTFYKEVLGLNVTMDLGANVTLTGGIALQTISGQWTDYGRNSKANGRTGNLCTENMLKEGILCWKIYHHKKK